VGLLFPYTGEYGWVGNAENGIQLALEEINQESGGILTRDGDFKEVLLYVEDTASNTETAVAAANRLLDQDGVVALIGPTSNTILSILPLARDAAVVEISPTAGTTALDTRGGCVNGECVFRTVSSDVVMGSGMAWYAEEILGATEVAYFFGEDPGALSIQDVLKDAATVLDLQSAGEIFFSSGQPSYVDELQEIFSREPEVVFFEAFGEDAAVFLREWSEQGYGGQWVGTDFVNDPFTEAASPYNEGVYGVNPGSLPGERFDSWFERYVEMKGSSTLDAFAANSYDAMNIIALALEKGGEISRSSVRENIRDVANPPGEKCESFTECAALLRDGQEIDYDGVAGPQDFNEFGDVITPLKVEKIEDASLVRLGSLTNTEIGDVVEGVLALRAGAAEDM
jgi:ABC-type branched-subunit amino acid transport system substrate-binding protein